MSEFYLRTESIRNDDILDLFVSSDDDNSILASLISSEPCLLEGSRGAGKSFLMKVAEQNLNSSQTDLAVPVSFSVSSLVNTNDELQFYHWMLAKTIKALSSMLRKRGLQVTAHSSTLLSNSEFNNSGSMEQALTNIIKKFESSYKHNSDDIDLNSLPEIEDVKEAIEILCQVHELNMVHFFFDEAAHVFRPEQQRQFFNLYKDLRSPYISCNAAIYPGVSYFGPSFEPTHDCKFIKLERDIRDPEYINYFKEMVLRQANEELKKRINERGELFATLAYCCGGNPRMLFRSINSLEKWNSTAVGNEIKRFYRTQIWTEHTELGEKYQGHEKLVDWGRDFIESEVLPSIEEYNQSRARRNQHESTIYFWLHKDSPQTVKESLRLLTYTGVVRKLDSGVRATRRHLGTRYEIKYGCVLALLANPTQESVEFQRSLSIKKFTEFGRNYPAFSEVAELQEVIDDDQEFLESVKSMLQKEVSVLQLLTDWQKGKLIESGISTLEQLHAKTENELIEKIYQVGPVRAKIMKNAADAELLEYLSG